jgi:hypothetical protein
VEIRLNTSPHLAATCSKASPNFSRVSSRSVELLNCFANFGMIYFGVKSSFIDRLSDNISGTTTKQNKTKQNKTKQNKTKQNKTKQNKTKQNKTKQNKTKIKKA